MTIAIIGAGIAGLTAARDLIAAGQSVAVFDKSGRAGGRLATRARAGMQFDHGAVAMCAERPAFAEVIADWRQRGLVARWAGDHMVGVPGMNAPPCAWAHEFPVAYKCQVSGVHREGNAWRLTTADGPVQANGSDAFDAVVLAIPAPQALALAAPTGLDATGLRPARYAPCWTLMMAFDAPLADAPHGALPDDSSPDDAMISRIVRDSRKPGRSGTGERLVVHATAAWSREHLELTPHDAAGFLFMRALAIVGTRVAPFHVDAHRWRYALVEEAAGEACIWDPALRAGACGDWCLGPRVEDAFESGLAMARAILATA
jgi:predicted NAD/FAD-dependent oxidoreductase